MAIFANLYKRTLVRLRPTNSCSNCARGFNDIHCFDSNYLRVLIFAILLSFAEIAEINTRENMSP